MSITSQLLSLSTKLIPNRPIEEIEKQLSGLRSQFDGRLEEFQKDLRQGRGELVESVMEHSAGMAGQRWVEFAAGGGEVLRDIGERIELLARLDLVDTSDESLAIARQAVGTGELANVRAVVGDPLTFRPAEPVDVVLLPYCLSTTEDWFTVVDNAREMLRPGGLVGVVDFYAARGSADPAGARLAGLLPRLMGDGTYASADFGPYLKRQFELVSMDRRAADIPYVPIGVPYFRFVGRKRSAAEHLPTTAS